MPRLEGLVEEECHSTEFERHMALLRTVDTTEATTEIGNTPLFTADVRKHVHKHLGNKHFTQHGLLAGLPPNCRSSDSTSDTCAASPDPRLFYNVTTPASVFICGSQGSGKSHTLSCLLENCLIPSAANVLPRPLTGIVFHYDTFNSEIGGSPAEAAYLSSSPDVQVRVLCAPTNRVKVEELYKCLPNVTVRNFRIHETQLNTKRMLDLMAMGSVAGDHWPLYMHTVTRILRDMRLEQQALGEDGFDYGKFKLRLSDEGLIGSQLGPLQQRLDALESFMEPQHTTKMKLASNTGKRPKSGKSRLTVKIVDDTWIPKPGQLTIVDLSCPCITDVTACSLFNICLSLFLEQDSDVGRVVALDEAHKFMKESMECATLTDSLLSAIRLQRHLAVRVFISTQEPTISPKLLDLCSVTVVHRFTSPEWLNTLKSHLAGASKFAGTMITRHGPAAHSNEVLPSPSHLDVSQSESVLANIFAQIVSLHTGEALVFAPSAAIGVCMERSISESDVESSVTSSNSGYESPTTAEDRTSARGIASSTVSKVDMEMTFQVNGCSAAEAENAARVVYLAGSVLKVYIRNRVTEDGGKSISSG